MIINISVYDESINPENGVREFDEIRRAIFSKFPNAIWERDSARGHKIYVPEFLD